MLHQGPEAGRLSQMSRMGNTWPKAKNCEKGYFALYYFFMKWITREHPKIDRLACPWLIRRFIDSDAEIIYVVGKGNAALRRPLYRNENL